MLVRSPHYVVTISSDPLLEALRDAGFAAEWVLPHGQRRLRGTQVMLRATRGARGIELRPAELERLAFELVDLRTWVEGIEEMIRHDGMVRHPRPYFKDEWKVWA